ncbi:DUF3658 domain-containing protein [Pantoea brenneri]|uniref:DUF3658 domain-containing protein n=1 Tax=Pantoea brenneri TaxID=472694 RepID=UPI00289CD317|nr:hypothetical protein [Pantoea brenneri]
MLFKYSLPLSEEICKGLLFECCMNEWQPGPNVVARAMYFSLIRYNLELGDLALEERLRYLATAGLIEIDDPSQRYGLYNVRLSEAYRKKVRR